MKYNKKIIFMVAGLVLVLITAVTTVFAAPDDNKEAVPMNNAVFSCAENSETDTMADFEEFQTAFGIKTSDANQQISVSVEPSKLNGVEFQVYITYAGESGSYSDRLVSTLNSSNSSFVYDYPDEAGDYTIELRMSDPGNTDCQAGTTNWMTTLAVEGEVSAENQFYNDNACQIIRGENVSPSENYAFMTSYNNLTAANKALLRKSGDVNEVTLCTERYISTFGLSRNTVLANITNLVVNLELAQKLSNTGTSKKLADFKNELMAKDYLYVENPSANDGIVLSCKEFVGLTGQDGLPSGTEPGEFIHQGDDGTADKGSWDTDYYTSVNQGKFYHESVTESENKYCKKTCVEAVTVSYGPPVATKGGICFEYKVKVVAKMVCEATINYDTKPKEEPVCNPKPVCNSTVKYRDQGGPVEDFDACILEKDGGEYTQDAIDSCYNEVYGYEDELANDMALVNDFNLTATPMLSYHLIWNSYYTYKKPNPSINYDSAIQIYHDVVNTNANGEGGMYVGDSNGIRWVCPSTNPNCAENSYFQLGGYYFHSPEKALQTIYNLNGHSYKSYSASLSGGYIMNGSFKAGKTCNDSCYWTGCSPDAILNKSEAVEDYNTKLAAWNAEVQTCLAEATCNEITSEYTMQVNIEDGEQKGDSNIEFNKPATDTSKNPFATDVTVNGESNMIIDNGACYGEGETSNKYMTEWTYPHTYINNKNGDVLYEKPGDLTGWREEENKFCLPLDQPDVNTLWFDWYVNNMVRDVDSGYLVPRDLGLGTISLTETEKTEILDGIEYNIFANTTNFGEYSWNIDIQCFFASRATNPTCEFDSCKTTDSGDGSGLDTSNDTPNNYKYRSITLENINTEDADLVGFNWSDDAKNYNNFAYPVDPTVVREDIADRGNSIYEGDEYLDYHFVLTTDNLKAIRDYNKDKTYLDYGNKFITDELSGVTFYVSDFLRDYLPDSAIEKIPNRDNACNNLLTKNSCESEGYINE